MKTKGHILILTGSPGAGKTTVAKRLALALGVSAVHLHTDDFWHFIKNGAIAPYLPEADAQNKIVMKVIATAAEEYAIGSYFVIVDGIIGPWFLDYFFGISAPVSYIVLQPDIDSAIARCRHRGGEELTDANVVRDLHTQLSNLGKYQKFALKTSQMSSDEVLNTVMNTISSKTHELTKQLDE